MEANVATTPNWRPLEVNVSPHHLEEFMHMGEHGTIQLYKHRDTRRYLNIDSDCIRFYAYVGGDVQKKYVEISRAQALLAVMRADG